MKLLAVSFHHVRDLPDVRVPLGSGGDPTIITGGAATGKTTMLEAIVAAIGACSPGALPLASAWLAPGKDAGAIELEWSLSAQEQERARVAMSNVTTRAEIKAEGVLATIPLRLREVVSAMPVEYFDAHRSLRDQAVVDPPARADVRRASRSPGKYAWVRDYLESVGRVHRASASAEPSRFATALETLALSLSYRGIRAKEGVRAVQCVFSRKGRPEVCLEELSGSEEAAVLFAATIAALPLGGGLVLLDTPELQMPSGDEDALVHAITKLLPDAQLVIATTSPTILRSAPRSGVIRLGASAPPVEHSNEGQRQAPLPRAASVPLARAEVVYSEDKPAPTPSKPAVPSYLLSTPDVATDPIRVPTQGQDRSSARRPLGEHPRSEHSDAQTMFAPSPEPTPALPFVEGAAVPPPATAPSASPESGETVPFTLPEGVTAARVTPFEAEASAASFRRPKVDLARFPIETFAAISGALARGDAKDAVLATYRLTPSLYDALSAAWGEKLSKDSELFRRFTELARAARESDKPA